MYACTAKITKWVRDEVIFWPNSNIHIHLSSWDSLQLDLERYASGFRKTCGMVSIPPPVNKYSASAQNSPPLPPSCPGQFFFSLSFATFEKKKMNSRLCRIALLATRSTQYHARPSMPTLITCQVRRITSTPILKEQYLQGYKDNERFHGKIPKFKCFLLLIKL